MTPTTPGLGSALAIAALTFAQVAQETPKPSGAMPLTSPVLGYLIMAVFGAAIITVSLLPSKRGHQD